MTVQQPATLTTWLARPMSAEVSQTIERLRRADDVCQLAVMPDVHLAGDVCVGLALATKDLIYPAAVGSDIGCGMAAIALHADADLLDNERAAARVLAGMYRSIPSIKHASETAPAALGNEADAGKLSAPRLEKLKHREGRYQCGTLGRGNHFVELQADQQDQLWLMVHSGSRGMGQAITSHHVQHARSAGQAERLVALNADSEVGQAYLTDAAWAVQYASENRLTIVRAVEQLFLDLFNVSTDWNSLIHSNHNHVRRETHGGEKFWVHRKGALSAHFGEPGVIPGSMGTASFHVVGRGNPAAFCSSSHGAGRRFSRGEATKRIGRRQFENEMRGVWFDHRLTGRIRDEAPSAYQDIFAVMRAQQELTRIERQLRPLLNYKGI